tara:strand:+ start:817 stop:1488 length:672 start_codon:yes stop_codon:yes gene_type:complete
MFWQDEGYLLSKRNFDENSIIIEAFTLNHGKYSGIVYGGSSRKQKRNYQIGNKILLNMRSKNENKIGYFNIELIDPISALFFDDKKRAISILSAASLLKILLPERQVNKEIYYSFDSLIKKLNNNNWINFYILWELSLIKDLGFDINLFDNNKNNTDIKNFITINGKNLNIPSCLKSKNFTGISNLEINEALNFNRYLLAENFIFPNKLRFPNSRNILQKYYN